MYDIITNEAPTGIYHFLFVIIKIISKTYDVIFNNKML